MYTRLLGRFAPIFYFNCEHFLFIYIAKQKRKKFCRFKKMVDFKNLMKFEFCWMQIFENSIIHKPSLGSRGVPLKIWAPSVQPVWRLLDTNGQTDKQLHQDKYIYKISVSCLKNIAFLQNITWIPLDWELCGSRLK